MEVYLNTDRERQYVLCGMHRYAKMYLLSLVQTYEKCLKE